MVYAEMAGRIELASRRTVFDLMRKRLGLRVGLVALGAALALNVLTLVAELGGMAFVAELVLGRASSGTSCRWPIVLALFIWSGSWSWQENLPSILGLATLVVPAALLFGSVPVSWSTVARSLVAPEPAVGGSHAARDRGDRGARSGHVAVRVVLLLERRA